MKRRLDQILVDRGLVPSREKAQALILAGQVMAANQKAEKPGHNYQDSVEIRLLGQIPFVSRGGFKLERALYHWHIDPKGMICLDVGASTGGFTDCLLQRGALKVHTVDVGPSQLDWKIQSDPRVVVHDHTNARTITAELFSDPISLIVMDVSFISVTLILPALARLLAPDGQMVVLVKPQFEVGREQVGKGGIVRDAALHQSVCEKIRRIVEELGFQTDLIESPILGAEGNKEFLLYGRH